MTKQEHKQGIILLYETQLQDAGLFMKIVLTEALRKLKETEISTKKVEKWVVKLEKSYNKI